MVNIFSEIEDLILFELNEELIFDKDKIKIFIFNFISNKLGSKNEKERPFFFEKIVYDFFEYMKFSLIKTPKTRDGGLDGIIKLKIELIGEADLGLQIKYKTIGSNDIDLFLSSLKNAELQLGALVCKDSRRLDKYELNSKIKTILLSKGIKLRERLIGERIDINPIFILKLDDLIEIVASDIRGFITSVYKK